MRKRVTLRSLMIVVAVLAIGLVPIRLHRQYRVDRVEFNRLVGDHKLASQMKKTCVDMAKIMKEVEESDRSMARMMRQSKERLDKLMRGLDQPGRPPVFVGPLGALGQATDEKKSAESFEWLEARAKQIEEPDPAIGRYEADAKEWTRREAAAQAAIDRFKATHWWF